MDFNLSKSYTYSVVDKKWTVKLRINKMLYADKFDTLEQAVIHSAIWEQEYVIEGVGQI